MFHIIRCLPLVLVGLFTLNSFVATSMAQTPQLQQIKAEFKKWTSNLSTFRCRFEIDRLPDETVDAAMMSHINPGFWMPRQYNYLHHEGNYRNHRTYHAADANQGKFGKPYSRMMIRIFDGENQFLPQHSDEGKVRFLLVRPLKKLLEFKGAEEPLMEVDYLRWAGVYVPNLQRDHEHPEVRSTIGVELNNQQGSDGPTIEKVSDDRYVVTCIDGEKKVEMTLDSSLGFAARKMKFYQGGRLTREVRMSNFMQVLESLWVPRFVETDRYQDMLFEDWKIFDRPIFHESAKLIEFDLDPEFPEDAFDFKQFKSGTIVADQNLDERLYRIPGTAADIQKVVDAYGTPAQSKSGPSLMSFSPTRIALMIGCLGCGWLCVTRIRSGRKENA